MSCTDERVSRPYALDLYGKRLAFGWTYAGRSEGLDTEIRLDTLGGGHARIAYQRGGAKKEAHAAFKRARELEPTNLQYGEAFERYGELLQAEAATTAPAQ